MNKQCFLAQKIAPPSFSKSGMDFSELRAYLLSDKI